MQGVEGQIFGPMARTYAYALLGAVIATFTVTPVLASILLPAHVQEVETFVVRHIRSLYQAVLVRAVRNYRRAAVIAAVFLVLCLSLGLRLGTEFLPKLEEGNLWIRAVMPPTITLEAGMDTVAKIRAIISSYPPVQTVFSEQGRGDEGTDPDGSFLAEFFVPLKPADTWPSGLTKEQMVKQMSERLNREFVGIDFNFSQYIQDNIEEAVSGVKGENSIKIFGKDLNRAGTAVQIGEDRTLGRSRRRRSRQLQSARPAQSDRPDRSRQGRALRLLDQRHQFRGAGRDRRPGSFQGL